jgi:DNA-binding beta-propeller fold protein YncE
MPYACCSGSGMGTCLDNTGLNLPVGLVVDSQGNIYVANNNGEDILEFAPITSASGPQNVAPIATISGGMTGLNIPLGINIAPFQ